MIYNIINTYIYTVYIYLYVAVMYYRYKFTDAGGNVSDIEGPSSISG